MITLYDGCMKSFLCLVHIAIFTDPCQYADLLEETPAILLTKVGQILENIGSIHWLAASTQPTQKLLESIEIRDIHEPTTGNLELQSVAHLILDG